MANFEEFKDGLNDPGNISFDKETGKMRALDYGQFNIFESLQFKIQVFSPNNGQYTGGSKSTDIFSYIHPYYLIQQKVYRKSIFLNKNSADVAYTDLQVAFEDLGREKPLLKPKSFRITSTENDGDGGIGLVFLDANTGRFDFSLCSTLQSNVGSDHIQRMFYLHVTTQKDIEYKLRYGVLKLDFTFDGTISDVPPTYYAADGECVLYDNTVNANDWAHVSKTDIYQGIIKDDVA